MERKDTGETPAPLMRLQEMNEKDKKDIQTALLKEALAISNERSNSLIERQNKLIEGMRSDIAMTEFELTETTEKAVREIKATAEKTERLNESIETQIRKAVLTSANDMKAEILLSVKEALSKTQEEIRKTEKAIEKQREDMRMESGVRRFLFWATPIFLLAQTIVLIIALL